MKTYLIRFALLVLTAGPGLAVQPARWLSSTQKEFLEGELKGVSVTSDGRLIPAPALEEVLNPEEAFIYAAVVDRGGNLLLGSGENGRIYRLAPGGRGGEWSDLSEPGVHALAVDGMNRVYAASGPDGKVFRLNDSGQPEVFFDPGDKYIWSLAVDSANNLYVGTGPSGRIYRVTQQGEDSVYYETRENHVVSLALDMDGNLLAGTAPAGLLFRVREQGAAVVLYDSPLEEVRAIRRDRYGNIYFAALAAASRPAAEVPESNDPDQSPPSGPAARGEQNQVTLEIHKVDKLGMVSSLYSSPDEIAFDLLARDNGDLLVATGNRGRIISIDPRNYVTFLAQTTEEQVTRLVESGRQIYAVTSNLGKVFRMGNRTASPASYESRVLDAGMLSRWGVIRRQGGNGVALFTRSGNTGKPDATWSDWSGPYRSASQHSLSPPARFLQWKLEFEESASSALAADSGGVDWVSVTYLQNNMAPRLTGVTVHPAGVVLAPAVQPNPATVSPGGPNQAHATSLPREVRALGQQRPQLPPRGMYMPGARSISWEASDPNQDDLIYSLHYRHESDSDWKLLAADVSDTYHTLDGLSFPNGTYLVKVVASDEASNPPSRALTGEMVARPFVIANASPRTQFGSPRLTAGRLEMPFTAHTEGSSVFQAEYAVDAGKWVILFPEDGIADSADEQYTIRAEGLTSGQRTIRVRVIDSVGNVGTASTVVAVP